MPENGIGTSIGNTLTTDASHVAEGMSATKTNAQNGSQSAMEKVKNIADWVKRAADEAIKMLDTAKQRMPTIPPLLLLCRIKNLPGMSAITLAATIIQELSNRGYNMEVNFDGSRNCIVEFVEVIATEVVKHIKDYAKTSNVMVTPAGPVLIEGQVE